MNDPNMMAPDMVWDEKMIRLPREKAKAPRIQWGEKYQEWTVEQRLEYAEELACSMNHAADVMQQERNQLLVDINHMQGNIAALQQRIEKQNMHLATTIAQHNQELQKQYAIAVEYRRQLGRDLDGHKH